MISLSLSILKETFAICRFSPTEKIPDWTLKGSFYSVTHTDDELSVVCPQNLVENAEKIDKGWKVFKVEGALDFSLVGIMANLSSTLASGGVGVFVISTYDTDYVLVKKENLEKAIELLSKAGHKII